MKKIILFSIFLMSISCICMAEDEVKNYNPNRPEWSDFCPFGLENVNLDEKTHISYQARANAKENNYWVHRRQEFNKGLEFCDNLQNNLQGACYNKLAEKQIRYNSQHEEDKKNALQKMFQDQQRWAQFGQNLSQQNYQQQQLNLQRDNMILQNMPKWSDSQPKTYNVNVRRY